MDRRLLGETVVETNAHVLTFAQLDQRPGAQPVVARVGVNRPSTNDTDAGAALSVALKTPGSALSFGS